MCFLFTENVSSWRISKSFLRRRGVAFEICEIHYQFNMKSTISKVFPQLRLNFCRSLGSGLVPSRAKRESFRGRSAVSFPERRLVMEPLLIFLVVNVWVNFKCSLSQKVKKVCSFSLIVNLRGQKVINIGRLPFNFFYCLQKILSTSPRQLFFS